ncbi:MAG: ATP-binding protein [Myxococcota bacterium]
MAHDVDNALTAIVTHATLIKASSTDAFAVAHAEAILRSARAASEVVERVRSVLRERADAPGRVAVDVDALVDEAIAVARTRGRSRGVEVTRGPGRVGAAVAGQVAELLQVVVNLTHNAIDASPPGLTVVVSAEARDGEAVVSVQDWGAGIPAAVQAHLFEPFFTTKGGAGTGLGLALARSIATSHGGTLVLDSVTDGDGRGTTATLVLPLAHGDVPGPAPATDVQLDGAGGGHVLLVDDEPATREALATLLAAAGFEVTAAERADEALASFFRVRPDAVVTDLQLGDEDGAELVMKLSAADPSVPIVIASGVVAAPGARAWAGRVAATFEKPISPGRLIARLRELIARRRALTRHASKGDGR